MQPFAGPMSSDYNAVRGVATQPGMGKSNFSDVKARKCEI